MAFFLSGKLRLFVTRSLKTNSLSEISDRFDLLRNSFPAVIQLRNSNKYVFVGSSRNMQMYI